MNRDGRSFLCPEVIQASTMDCGPAALKALAEGLGVTASYGRLREACQTSVDGTSIDDLERVALNLGLDAEQVLQPYDHALDPSAQCLPAILVTRTHCGAAHFVVLWRTVGRWVQIMDPETGRRWVRRDRLRQDLYLHTQTVDPTSWHDWASEEEFLAPLCARLRNLGLTRSDAWRLIQAALASEADAVARLDAAARAVKILADAQRKLGRRSRREMLLRLAEEAGRDPSVLPDELWTARPVRDENGRLEGFAVRGALLIRARRAPRERSPEISESYDKLETDELGDTIRVDSDRGPWLQAWDLARERGLARPLALALAAVVSALGFFVQAIVLRGLIDLGLLLATPLQKGSALIAVLVLLLSSLLLTLGLGGGLRKAARHLDLSARSRLLAKLPLTEDRFFRSRLVSDLAERAHSLSRLRHLPHVLADSVRALTLLGLTVAGISWLDPRSAPFAGLAGFAAVMVPLLSLHRLSERELKVRSHAASMGRFYLDALLGLTPLRTHGGAGALRTEFSTKLASWRSGSLGLHRGMVAVEAVQATLGLGLAASILSRQFSSGGSLGAALLLVYWALQLPALGDQLAQILVLLPQQRNILLRLLEPLSAPSEPVVTSAKPRQTAAPALELSSVLVRAGSSLILDDVDLRIEPGDHVAIVGRSGAGKSSLVRLFLGLQTPISGTVRVDGEPLRDVALQALRRQTAWVDPSVQLWRSSLLDNVLYGADRETDGEPHEEIPHDVGALLSASELDSLLCDLPQGLQTPMGDRGSRSSGGEAQRVRLARALAKGSARLVILDEAFRGLDRGQRARLLDATRRHFAAATLLHVTHDLEATASFDRVIVMDRGRIVEAGSPVDLREDVHSLYFRLLAAEISARHDLWSSDHWRKLRLRAGRLEPVPLELARRSRELGPQGLAS